jgi:hypothetical protein
MKFECESDLEYADTRIKRELSPATKRRIAEAYKKRRATGSTTKGLSLRIATIIQALAMHEDH